MFLNVWARVCISLEKIGKRLSCYKFYNVRVYRFPRSLYRFFHPMAFAELASFTRRYRRENE